MASTDWINTKERLPDEDDTVVLIHTPDEGEPVWVGFYDSQKWRTIDGYPIEGRVLHWMRLPDPPGHPTPEP